MKLPGFDEIQNHLPDYDQKQTRILVLRLPGFALLFLLIQIVLLYGVQYLAKSLDTRLLDYIEWAIPIINNILFVLLGTATAQKGFTKKKEMLEKNGKHAYQQMVKTILLGISMAFSGIFFGYIPILNAKTDLAVNLSTPLDTLFIPWNFWIIRFSIGAIFFIIGILAAIRAVFTFGIDTATMVYVYYPDEAKLVDNEIYSIVRHPMYLAVILIAAGGFVFYLSAYSLIYFGIVIFSFFQQIIKYEERELIQRFGNSYKEYSKKTPAIFIRPKNWGKFFRFLLGRSNTKKSKI